MSVAQTILNQLGGSKFIAMTGAKNFVSSPCSLRFKHMRCKNPAGKSLTNCVITIGSNDTYTMEFWNVRGTSKCERLAEVCGVFADELRTVFTANTGLDTSIDVIRK